MDSELHGFDGIFIKNDSMEGKFCPLKFVNQS